MKPKSCKQIILLFLIIILVSACATKKTEDPEPKPKPDPNLLFADTFVRADATTAGVEWQEVKLRNGSGNTATVIETGDSPWGIKNNVLSYEGIGNKTYTEDYIETTKEFPVNNTLVEFEIRGNASTTLGYVGPSAFWAPASSQRLGTFKTVDNKDSLIGIQAAYGWETAGSKGMSYYLNGSLAKAPEGTFAGINGTDFVKHTILVKDNKLTHTVGGTIVATYDLTTPLNADAKRHFSFDVRFYDSGVAFKVEIRNLKITIAK